MGLLGTVTTLRCNLGTFYFAVTEPYDWTLPQNNSLWQDGVKTLFDPCSAGWRVPFSGAVIGDSCLWKYFTVDNGIWNSQPGTPEDGFTWNIPVIYNNSTWYPTAGCRHRTSGSIMSPNSSGYYWAATAQDIGAYSCYYSSGAFGHDYIHNRANCFSVRCLRE